MKKILKTKKGFTLIELLVVIGIIGILATIGAVSFGSARAKARDAKRIGDMRTMQSAIEVLSADQNGYPTTVNAATWAALETLAKTSNITPPGTTSYCYYAKGTATSILTSYGATQYVLAAGLENEDAGGTEVDQTITTANEWNLINSGTGCTAIAAAVINCDDSGSAYTFCLVNSK